MSKQSKKTILDLAPKLIPEEELDGVSGGITGASADEIFTSGVVESDTVSLFDDKSDSLIPSDSL